MNFEPAEDIGNSLQPHNTHLEASHIEGDNIIVPPKPIAEKWIHYHLENAHHSPQMSDQAQGRLNIENERAGSDNAGHGLAQDTANEESGNFNKFSKWKNFAQLFIWLLFTA